MVNYYSANAPLAPKQSRLQAMWRRAKQNPRWLIMESLSRFALVRHAARLVRRPLPVPRYDLSATKFHDLDVDASVASLRRDGYCTGLNLPADVVRQILAYVDEAYCYGDANPRLGFKYADKADAERLSGRTFSQATYFWPDELQPMIDAIAGDPALLTIAAQYLDARPVMTGSRLWWIFAAPQGAYDSSLTTSFFHYDKDDYAAVRLFFYLTQVDEEHGPHVVVRGSHTDKKLSEVISLGERQDRQILDYYGSARLTKIYGAPGAGFAEDPFCFHKATRPQSGDRLMLEVKYAIRDYHIFPPPDRARRARILDAASQAAPVA